MNNFASNMIKSKILSDSKTFALTKSSEFYHLTVPLQPKFQYQRLATRAQPTQQLLTAVMPQLHIWNVPPLPLPSASAPPATAGPLAATAVGDKYSFLSKEEEN